MQVYLQKHASSHAHHTVKIIWQRVGREVSIEYAVQKRDGSPWLSDPVYGSDWSKNWGLWNKDVVEAFLQLRSTPDDLNAPYLEIQVSPANQPFALIIREPRKVFHAPAVLDFKTEALVEGRGLKGTMTVTLPEELQGDLLYGGFFSCLSTEPREFYALEPNPEASPDFHRPELFISLDEQ